MQSKKCKLILSKFCLIGCLASVMYSVPVSAGVPQNFSSLISSSIESSSDYIKQQAERMGLEGSDKSQDENNGVEVTFLTPDSEKEAKAKKMEEEMKSKNAEKQAEEQSRKQQEEIESAIQQQLNANQELLSKLMAEAASKPVVSNTNTYAGVPGSVEGKTPHDFVVTAYCNCIECCGVWSGGPTASGAMPRENHTIAVDPTVIPLGTKVVFNGIEYTAEDTGSAIKGNRIDLYFEDHNVASDWGVQNVTVWY